MSTTGTAMHDLIRRLYPICRSITGDGVRETLRILQQYVPLVVHEVPSGTKVLDWVVPKEWNIRDAWVKNSAGQRVVDFRESNLHVVSYSTPISRRMKLAELKDHLFTAPSNPDWVPYRTSYYESNWGFCLSGNQLKTLNEDEEYEVCIDSSLTDGSLTYGELLLEGEEAEEVLISSHICHPSLANDNLSGIALAIALARGLKDTRHRYTYRFLFAPGTIGAITWLARNEAAVERVRHGLVLTCVGDAGDITYKRSRRGNANIDRAFAHVLKHSGQPHQLIDFFPCGYDERQYCSPGYNLAVGCFMRSRHGEFPEYHTSADNPDFTTPDALADSLAKCQTVIEVLEQDRTYVNQNSKGEPQLGRRNAYSACAEGADKKQHDLAVLWVLNLSDGMHTLLEIAERSGLPFATIENAAAALQTSDLLVEKESPKERRKR